MYEKTIDRFEEALNFVSTDSTNFALSLDFANQNDGTACLKIFCNIAEAINDIISFDLSEPIVLDSSYPFIELKIKTEGKGSYLAFCCGENSVTEFSQPLIITDDTNYTLQRIDLTNFASKDRITKVGFKLLNGTIYFWSGGENKLWPTIPQEAFNIYIDDLVYLGLHNYDRGIVSSADTIETTVYEIKNVAAGETRQVPLAFFKKARIDEIHCVASLDQDFDFYVYDKITMAEADILYLNRNIIKRMDVTNVDIHYEDLSGQYKIYTGIKNNGAEMANYTLKIKSHPYLVTR